jgi:hypothetical protein
VVSTANGPLTLATDHWLPRQWHAANVQDCAFLLLLAFLIAGKVSPLSWGKSRFNNQLPIAGSIARGVDALAAQVLLKQARKEAADAE